MPPLPIIPIIGVASTVVTAIVVAEVIEPIREKRRAEKQAEEDEEMREIQGTAVLPARMKPERAKPPLFTVPAELAERTPGINLWGSGAPGEVATWQPAYLKSEGCKDLRWGVCFSEWIDVLQTDPSAPAWTKNLDEILFRVADGLSMGSGAIAEWLTEQACLRFKWPLYAYRSPDGASPFAKPNERLWSVDRGDAPILTSTAPPHPFPDRDGWRKVWVSSVAQPMTRNPTARIVFWPDGGVAELVSTTEIRGMLRMDPQFKGAVKSNQLAGADCDTSRWWPARRDKAMPEFR